MNDEMDWSHHGKLWQSGWSAVMNPKPYISGTHCLIKKYNFSGVITD